MASTWTKRTAGEVTILGRRYDPVIGQSNVYFTDTGSDVPGAVQCISAGINTSLEARARNVHRSISQVEPECWWTVVVHLTDGREVRFSGSGWNERQIQVLITRAVNGKFQHRGPFQPSSIPWPVDLGTIDGPIASR